MAVAAVVLSAGIPRFQSYPQNNRQTIAINGLGTALQITCNSTVLRRIPVTLYKNANGVTGLPLTTGTAMYNT